VSFRQRSHYVHAAVLVLALAAPAFAADVQYGTELDPVAFDNSTVKNNVGIGHITAALSGRALTVSGDYSGLSSAATDAHLKMGLGRGVPGPVIGDLQITGGTSGQVSGKISLSAAQLKALQQGAISVVVNNDKAGPYGTLWGWLAVPDQNH
jgi:opacity protein-like surface antigen